MILCKLCFIKPTSCSVSFVTHKKLKRKKLVKQEVRKIYFSHNKNSPRAKLSRELSKYKYPSNGNNNQEKG